MGSLISSAYQYIFRKRETQWLDIDDFNPDESGEQNQLMLQAFEWYVPDDQKHWRRLLAALPSLKAIGVTSIWLPPGCKAMSPSGNGYDIYDLYDLGEFDQKGSRATKWGTKEELVALVKRAHEMEIAVIWDTVLNHKAAADHTERCVAVRVNPKDRRKIISEPEEIEAWLGFSFPGRGTRYSKMKYHWYHFTGVDYNARNKKTGIYKIMGPDTKDWARDVSKENGNYDYLMFANLDYSHPEVREDVLKWIQWIGDQLPIAGLRLDAVKHYSAGFLKEFIGHVQRTVGPGWFLVAEYWKVEVRELLEYLGRMDYLVSLFDAPLVHRFSQISRTAGADLRRVFEGTLVKHEQKHAVTFVMNHDTQPSQSLEEPIEDFFKPLAYALILLRKEGHPCLFYGDLYGMCGGCQGILKPSCNDRLADLALARKLYAYGRQRDYFDKRNCIGFVRLGDSAHPDGLACVLSNGPADTKRMYVGKAHAGSVWTEVYGYCRSRVKIDSRGYGVFGVVSRNVSVWVREDAMGRESFGKFDSDIYSYLVTD
ncbi:alpha-amylase [Blastomyces dermatitidis ATCC 18188]|uniref:Alpha-amylase n=2 Tax=Ajellomyces dermatitidis (strain ATCC 18188 / CBS 674.68) TaxID=653446 RepID=F2TUD5_AJEDA|nr:alpha-amylase [Blastomyces dermatitidis ATCC 18188]